MDKNQVVEILNTQVEWLGQSAFRLTMKNSKVIYIDPFRIHRNSPRADYIFLTHSHGDHYNAGVVQHLKKPETKIICPVSMPSVGTDLIEVGQERDFGELWVKGYHAYNQRGFPHSHAKCWLGYLIRFENFSIYHAGDTDSSLEIAGMKPDLALLPIAGFVTFSIKNGVDAALKMGAVLTAPIHYGLIPGTKKNGERFAAAYPGDSVILKKI